jgi:short-subunit dehydrogenase
VINSAGIGFYGDILSYPLEDQLAIIKLNVEALSAITIEAARSLQRKNLKGTILNVSSAAANYTYPGFALYAASKRFVKEFSLSFDLEVSKYGIRILTALPGRFASPFLQKASSPKEFREKKSWDIMSLEKTADLILQQIQKQKKSLIIDFRYRILAFFSLFVPQIILAKILKKNSITEKL